MWLDNLKSLKAEKGLSVKQISERSKVPERTISRILSGETDNPYVETLTSIVEVMGASLEDIFADTQAVVGRSNLAALQAENERLNEELALISAENTILKEKVSVLTAENEILNLQISHKDEIISLHNYYINKLKTE